MNKLLIRSFLYSLAVMAGAIFVLKLFGMLVDLDMSDIKNLAGCGMGVLGCTFGIASWKKLEKVVGNDCAKRVCEHHLEEPSDVNKSFSDNDSKGF